MHKPDVWKLVFAYFSSSKPPFSLQDWRMYIQQYIIPEVKQEGLRFYGHLDDYESQNPGLDYANPAHRLRLMDYKHHRALFRVFDKLRLTQTELYHLCKWHGTKRHRNDFERKHQVTLSDTTWEGVHPYQPSEPIVTIVEDIYPPADPQDANLSMLPDGEDEDMEDIGEDEDESSDEEPEFDIESEDELQRSVGRELNERLMANAEANAEARARGEQVTTDSDWEQWLKEVAERNSVPGIDLQSLRSSVSGSAQASTHAQALVNSTVSSSFGQLPLATSRQQAAPSALTGIMSPPDLEVAAGNMPPAVQGH